MADEQVSNEKTAPEGQQETKKRKLGLPFKLGAFRIPILVVLVTVLAISTALVITKVSRSDAAAKQEHAKEAKKEAGKFIQLDAFTVNLASGGNYLQAAVAFEIEENEELEKELEDRKPQVNDTIITILSSKTIDDVSTVDGRQNLKAEIKKAVDSLLSYGKIERVYFTSFIMQ